MTQDDVYLYKFTFLYFDGLASGWLNNSKHVARVSVNKICLLMQLVFEEVQVLFVNAVFHSYFLACENV